MKSAIITGASSGIGFAIARELGRNGYALTVTSRRQDRLSLAADRLRAENFVVEDIALNMADEEAAVKVVARHEERFGRLDVLVNNAGMGVLGELDAVSVKHIDLQLAVNLRAVILGYRAALPLLRVAGAEHGNALVVNTASVTAIRPEPLMAMYATTKAAIVGLTRAMNLDLGDAGIKSTALCPGRVATEMTSDQHGHTAPEQMISAEDVASAVGWLLTLSSQCVVPEIPFLRPGNKG